MLLHVLQMLPLYTLKIDVTPGQKNLSKFYFVIKSEFVSFHNVNGLFFEETMYY